MVVVAVCKGRVGDGACDFDMAMVVDCHTCPSEPNGVIGVGGGFSKSSESSGQDSDSASTSTISISTSDSVLLVRATHGEDSMVGVASCRGRAGDGAC